MKNLGTNTEGDHLYILDTPEDIVGPLLEGVLYGHTIEIMQNGRGEFMGTMDGKKIPNEKAKQIVIKWRAKAMDKEWEDENIERAKDIRKGRNEVANFNDALELIAA